MKNLMIAFALVFSTSAALACVAPAPGNPTRRVGCAFPSKGPLDGMKFCRTVNMGGMFGQPKGPRQHCLTFSKAVATDNANTFFGNPPEHYPYSLDNGALINAGTGEPTGYVLVDGNLVIAETGAVLTPAR